MCSLASYNEMVILPWGSMQEQKELIFLVKKCSRLAKKTWVLPKRFSLEMLLIKGLLTHTSDNFWQLQLRLNSRSRCCWEASNRSGCLLIYIKMRCEAGTKLPLLISPIPQFLRKENPQVWARVTSRFSHAATLTAWFQCVCSSSCCPGITFPASEVPTPIASPKHNPEAPVCLSFLKRHKNLRPRSAYWRHSRQGWTGC